MKFIVLFFSFISLILLFSGCASYPQAIATNQNKIKSALENKERYVAIISLKLNNVPPDTINELFPAINNVIKKHKNIYVPSNMVENKYNEKKYKVVINKTIIKNGLSLSVKNAYIKMPFEFINFTLKNTTKKRIYCKLNLGKLSNNKKIAFKANTGRGFFINSLTKINGMLIFKERKSDIIFKVQSDNRKELKIEL